MKKLFALLLAAVMCFSLVACGEDRDYEQKLEKYEEKIEKYEERIEKLEELLAQREAEIERLLAAGDGAESENTVTGNDNTQLESISKYLPYLCGEWKVLNVEDEGVLESVIITEDGNINIDGSNFKLKFQSEFEDRTSFEIIDGDTVAGDFDFHIEDNGDILIYLRGIVDGVVSLYKPEHYEVITITPENVYEYFEFRDFWDESRNAFGELTSVNIDTILVLKEPYYSRLSQQLMNGGSRETVVENGAIELLYKRSGLDVVLNLEDKTYSFENFKSGTEDTVTEVQGFGCYNEYAGFGARCLNVTPDSEGRHTYTWACAYEMEITRLELDLYLIAETD